MLNDERKVNMSNETKTEMAADDSEGLEERRLYEVAIEQAFAEAFDAAFKDPHVWHYLGQYDGRDAPSVLCEGFASVLRKYLTHYTEGPWR